MQENSHYFLEENEAETEDIHSELHQKLGNYLKKTELRVEVLKRLLEINERKSVSEQQNVQDSCIPP